MAIRPIVLYPDPVLLRPTREVESFDSELRELVKDMVDTMYASVGIGLAANQIGVPLRIFVADVSEGADGDTLKVFINPVITEESETPIGQMCIDVFGAGWGSFKIAHMSTGDKIGVEMFEFTNNESPKEFAYWKTSTFHFCVQDPDIEGLVEKIVAHGGKQRMPIREYYPGEKPYRMCYVEDPFGLIFEVYSHSYELTYSQGAY